MSGMDARQNTLLLTQCALLRISPLLLQRSAAAGAGIVIGAACNNVDSPDARWRFLSASGKTPARMTRYRHSPGTPGRVMTQRNDFFPIPDDIDATFVGISLQESHSIDLNSRSQSVAREVSTR